MSVGLSRKHRTDSSVLLSWTVRAVHCAYCQWSGPGGVLDKIALLLEHGTHLESVSLDLTLTEAGKSMGIPMTLHLLPLHVQVRHRN